MTGVTAAQRWTAALADWVIPGEILAQAPESPWGFPPSIFAGRDAPSTALHRLAIEGLGPGLDILDVGCGVGAASLPLASSARMVIGVDRSAAMLASFAIQAEAAGVEHQEVMGEWPAVAASAPAADVVVCRNVLYNVADAASFVTALSDHARARVVVEVHDVHPSVPLRPLWQRFWSLDRPTGPDASMLVDVVTELGFRPTVATEVRPLDRATMGRDDYVAFIRRRLCLPASADPQIASALAELHPDGSTGTAVIVAWDPDSRP